MPTLRHALRTLVRHRGPSTVIVLTLAIAIGGATVVYSVLDLFWHYIPAKNHDRLVFIASTDPRPSQSQAGVSNGVARAGMSIPDLSDMLARTRTIEQFAGFTVGTTTLIGLGQPERISIVRATTNLFTVWDVTPALGRTFLAEEGRPGAPRVALLTRAFWQRRFDAAPSALGRQLVLSGESYTVIGVLPEALDKGLFVATDIVIPVIFDPTRAARDERTLFVTGLLRPDVTREAASADLERVARQLQAEYPRTNAQTGVVVRPLIEMLGGNTPMLMVLLLVIAALLIAIACANISNVLLAAAATRQREFALRAAIGASLRHHVRQVLMESLLLSFAACVAGVFIAWAVTIVVQRMDPTAESFGAVAVNARVVLAAVVMAFLASLGFALLPAIRWSKVSVSALNQGSAGAGEHRSAQRLRHSLVAVQMAIAVVLLVQVGAFARTAWTFLTLEKGFDDTHLLTFSLELTPAQYADAASINRFVATLLPQLEALPGVISAAAINRLPVAERELSARMRIEGTSPRPEEEPTITLAKISAQYLNTLKIPLVQGRAIDAADVASRHSVALLSQAAARRYWPGSNPIGARITLDRGNPQSEWLEVIGIVGNVRNSQADQAPAAQVYVPLSLSPDDTLSFAVRTSDADSARLAPAIRTAVASLDNQHPVFALKTMEQVMFDDLQGTILLVSVLVGIALVSLSLAAAGIYGLTAFSVTRRTREIGVRMALGASPGAVLRLILSQSMRPVLIGALFGTAAAVALASFAAHGISEVDFRDPMNYASVVVALITIAMIASIVPARRATAVNPVDALRAE